MQKILLDTDIGGDIDDAICLAYLLKEPQCDLLGITTVCGEPEKRAAVADAICRAAGRQVPIVAGLDTTLQPVPLYPTPEGAGALEQWPHSTYEKGDAPEFLYEKIRENPHQVVLIAIGNLTNVATLFTAHPDAVGLLKGLSVMNGYFGQERLPEPLYNWNSWADPMASKIVFASAPAFHRAVPLEVTDTLTIEAEQAEVLFPADSPLLQAVYAFGNAWLESSSKLTLHDPLAAVSVFHPDICQFERGFVQVETERESDMGGTAFTPSPQGTVEIARSVDRERFYRIVSATLRGEGSGESRRSLPEAVLRRAQSLGAVGEAWLANLESTIAALEGQWNVTVGQALSGGTHGFVAPADGKNGEAYVVKIELPDGLGGDFTRGVTALEKAGGQGYAKLYAYDTKRKACLLERLLQGGDVLPGLAVARGQQRQGGELLRGEVGHAAVLPRQAPEVPVVEDHRHPVGGELHVYLRVLGAVVPCGPHSGQRVFRLVDTAAMADDHRRVEQLGRRAAGQHPGGQPQAQRHRGDAHAPALPPSQHPAAEPSQLPAEHPGQDGGVPLPGGVGQHPQLLLGVGHGQQHPDEQGHGRRVQHGTHHPVSKVDAEGLGIEEVAEEGGVEIHQAQAVAPPILGHPGEQGQPQQQGAQHGKAPAAPAALPAEASAPGQ